MKLPLKFWVITVTMVTMIVVLISIFATIYYVNRQTLKENTINENYSNAKKLSALTNDTFLLMEQTLLAHHETILSNWDNSQKLNELTQNLKKSNSNFNSIAIIDKNGIGKANTPDLKLMGTKVDTEGVRLGLLLKRNFTSSPYIGKNQKLMLIVSTALYKDGKYFGMLNGLVWLREKNFLTHLLEETYGNDKYDVAVYDSTGTYIYHKKRSWIGTKAHKHQATINLDKGRPGKGTIVAQTGEQVFAGYTTVPQNDWRIISMTPVSKALAPAQLTAIKAATIGFPLILISFLVLIGLIIFITKPLNRLSLLDYKKPIGEIIQETRGLNSPYREAENIRAMILSFAENQQVMLRDFEEMAVTDPMTGLANRRRLNQLIQMIRDNEESFGYVLLDIDRFKSINDTYGHVKGDQVLIKLAKLISSVTPHSGLPIRIGGEEFAIILQETSPDDIIAFSEHLRHSVEQTDFSLPQRITVSIGAGYLGSDSYDVSHFYNDVDQQLYKAKRKGRNRVETVFIIEGKKYIS
ncbi:hypothetical protein ADM98_01110 [Exiguobacterium sp. BMC-KP]|uniref:sensor domain-containing diguanylate cyclase n=1 Tax=Exiguobacterium sp. BMC-KP TaxID=1684312 RepID=UPI0006AA4236|nr:sensor domain-containing diguanylate cyclase [Exiguobacterium sp. BMC-KP]KOP31470.1 hypothetical protein ADM98_01110 [Exiguobacterium sp. BMC-KP]